MTHTNDLTQLNSRYLNDISPYSQIDEAALAAENLRLITEYARSQDLEIRNRLVLINQRLIIKIAKRLCGGDKEKFLDNISAGNIGMIRAIEKFDINGNSSFSTFAYYRIMGEIHSVTYNDNKFKIPGSLEQLEEANELEGVMEDRSIEPIEIMIEKKMIREQLLKTLSEYLTEEELDVIIKIFGFEDREYKTQEIADMLNIEPSRVRTILEQSLRKLRKGALPKIKNLQKFFV